MTSKTDRPMVPAQSVRLDRVASPHSRCPTNYKERENDHETKHARHGQGGPLTLSGNERKEKKTVVGEEGSIYHSGD